MIVSEKRRARRVPALWLLKDPICMEIVEIPVNRIKPYDKNPRRNDGAVETVAASIAAFGFKVPLVIDKGNVVVTGHTRLRAAKQLGMKTVPCIKAEDLTDEQIKAFRLADNKTAELAGWDFDLLNEEMEDILTFDMGDFGFELYDPAEAKQDNARKTQKRVENICNLGKGQYEGSGKYDIPQIQPVKKLPAIKEWIGFNEVLSDTDPDGKAVHFFIDDYQFERIWKDPGKYVDALSRYVCVASPDFSPYGDMPLALQIYNHYRKHWVAAFLQERGVTVIPTIRASTDSRSFEWFLDGEPEGGIVIISNMWTGDKDIRDKFHEEYKLMFDKLHPRKVFLYGTPDETLEGKIELVKTFTSKRYSDD